VTVLNRQRARRVNVADLKRFLERLAAAEPSDAADRLAACLVSDSRMREMNLRFRGKDATTDVLAFVGDGAPEPEGSSHLGDVVVSVERAARQAREAGHSLERELKTLLLHGYLHLIGYDHETDDGTMRRTQRTLVARLLPRTRPRAR